MLVLEDRTTLNPSTIDVMVDSPSKKQKNKSLHDTSCPPLGICF